MPKDISRDEAMLNSKKIKPIALAVIKLCLSEGIRKEVSQLVENSIEYLKKSFVAIYLKRLGSYRRYFGQTNTAKVPGLSIKLVFG